MSPNSHSALSVYGDYRTKQRGQVQIKVSPQVAMFNYEKDVHFKLVRCSGEENREKPGVNFLCSRGVSVRNFTLFKASLRSATAGFEFHSV